MAGPFPLSLSLSLSLRLSFFLSLSVSLYLSMSLCLTVSVSQCLCVSSSFCLSVCSDCERRILGEGMARGSYPLAVNLFLIRGGEGRWKVRCEGGEVERLEGGKVERGAKVLQTYIHTYRQTL